MGMENLKKIIKVRKNPKQVNLKLKKNKPSKELLKALQEVEDILSGKIKTKSYTNMYEMLNDLKA